MTDYSILFERFWNVVSTEIANMWWFTLLSVVVAALIKTYQWDMKIRALLQKKVKTGILFAAVVGMVSPLCSCGILPIAISLAAAGVPLPPLMALLFTSPVMGPEALLITYGGLGGKFAVIKLIFSFVFGVMTGYAFYFLQKTGFFKDDAVRLRPMYNKNGELSSSYEIACANDISIKTMQVVPRESRFRFFLDRFKDMGIFIGMLTLIAIAVEGLIFVLVPQDFIKSVVGYSGIKSLIITAFAGGLVPLNQIAAVPVIKGLMAMGMTTAAGVTLMFSGPVMSIPSAIVLFKVFRPRVFFAYMALCLIFSILAGVVFL